MPLPLRLAGGIWGHLVGDAMGVPYEFIGPESIGDVRWGREGGVWNQPPGTWSDDGALMLALLDSLLTGGFDTEDQGRRAVAWWRGGAHTPDGKYFDIGGTTSAALRAIEAGTRAEQAGPTGDRSQSNGSLMRILPLALWANVDRVTDGDLIDLAFRASKVTHGHAACQVVCAVYVLLARALLSGAEDIDYFEHGFSPVRLHLKQEDTQGNSELMAALQELHNWPDHHHPEGRGGALDAFWSAWTAFTGATSYAETIERAIRYGNDTDTTAAIAGGLAGIRWGLDGIPPEWRNAMRGRQVAEPLVERLIEAQGWRTSRSHPIRVDWVNLASVPGLAKAPGRLGMTFLPGKQYLSDWSGEWWRDLERDVARLRGDHMCDVFLLLVEDHELEWTRTTDLPSAFERHGIELRRHQVVDMNVPTDRAAYGATLDGLVSAVREGRSVVVACRGGLGRTGTAVACALAGEGMDADDAILLTRASRKNTIERGVQVDWVRAWAR
jgi:ADP-ribosylglycohydrolase/protein-tyrosine phosphatase